MNCSVRTTVMSVCKAFRRKEHFEDAQMPKTCHTTVVLLK